MNCFIFLFYRYVITQIDRTTFLYNKVRQHTLFVNNVILIVILVNSCGVIAEIWLNSTQAFIMWTNFNNGPVVAATLAAFFSRN